MLMSNQLGCNTPNLGFIISISMNFQKNVFDPFERKNCQQKNFDFYRYVLVKKITITFLIS